MRIFLPVLLAAALSACTADPQTAADVPAPAPETPAAEAAETLPPADSSLPVMTVYKTPTCGCCALWVTHLQENGFSVETVDLPSLAEVKAQYGIPDALASCHTGVVDGYVVEGHVPAEDVKRLLEEQPDAAGLTVPGMPIGSPGMEVEGQPAEAYDVYLVADGEATVFARH